MEANSNTNLSGFRLRSPKSNESAADRTPEKKLNSICISDAPRSAGQCFEKALSAEMFSKINATSTLNYSTKTISISVVWIIFIVLFAVVILLYFYANGDILLE